MQSFLQLVAHDLYTKIGNDLSRTVLVFPNKRANLFFNEYLAGESDKPIWSPAAMSISDLFQKLSVQKSGDPIRLVCELYKVFKEETRSQETLDDFYFWGELLISDFDDVDKNMVDADKLFSNLQDLKNLMDDYEFLDKEQEEAIQQFFQNFSIEKRTELKEKFISLWDKLGTIYHRYRANLTELGIAYEGMLYRNVIEQLDTDQLKYDKYIFVGFNVLNKVESDFFRKLKDAGKALFYWDYDIFYTQQIKKHEAGEFLKRNLEEFPNELPESFFNTFKEPKKIRYISASTENAQARFLPGWIKAITNDHSQITVEKEKENAVSILAGLITNFSHLAWVQNAFAGIQVCVCVLIFNAVLKLLKKSVVDKRTAAIFLIVMAGSLFLHISPVWFVVVSAVAGILLKNLEGRAAK